MKRKVFNLIAIIIYLGLGFFLTTLWFNLLYDWSLHQQILGSILSAMIILLVEISRPVEKSIKEEQPLVWRVIRLNNEDDVMLLRDLQTLIRKKLSHSVKNKMIIKATKELCGKQCKCLSVKKARACTCGMFDEYVKYLSSEQTEE